MDTIVNIVLAVSAVAGVSIAFLEYRGKNAERARANAERERAEDADMCPLPTVHRRSITHCLHGG